MTGFPYKRVLVIGATSGIGEALAARIISHGSKVIVVGRRKEHLDAFVAQHGPAAASAMPFDITDLAGIPAFAASVYAAHPDVDCVVLNAGIQRGFNFARPDSVDLDVVAAELTTNYTAYVHLSMAFLPHLQRAAAGNDGRDAALVFTTSGLALVPMLRCANYCASKAALHAFILVLREQVREAAAAAGDKKAVKIVEILPPAVQTELHDERHQPDIKNGASFGMPLKQFTDEAWAGLLEGKEQVPVGMAARHFEEDGFENKRQGVFRMLIEAAKKMGH